MPATAVQVIRSQILDGLRASGWGPTADLLANADPDLAARIAETLAGMRDPPRQNFDRQRDLLRRFAAAR
jgi:hypothetical protein